jgi:DNA gyrase subunit A
MIRAFTDFREEVIGRPHKVPAAQGARRAHVLVGLRHAVANIDEVIALFRKPRTQPRRARAIDGQRLAGKGRDPPGRAVADPAPQGLGEGTYRLSEDQARAILDLRLQRLTALGRDEIGDELAKLGGEITDYLAILRSRARIIAIVKDELNSIKRSSARRGAPRSSRWTPRSRTEDLIQREDMVVTVSHKGYIKRVPLSSYRAQRRGGKGRAGMATREEDFVTRIFIANTAHARAVLLLARHGLQDEGVAPADRSASGARQGADQSAALEKG